MSEDTNMLAMPQDLRPLGQKAFKTILNVLNRFGATDTGGCKAFYSPTEWKARGEQYGRESLLVVVYDGGEHRLAFEPESKMEYVVSEALVRELAAKGLYFEPCTNWYAAVYPIS